MDSFIAFNQKERNKKDNKNNFLSYFNDQGLFKYYQDALKNQYEMPKFEMGVCGYPAIEKEYIKKGYP